MADIWIEPEAGTLHGSFSADREPVAEVDSDDVVHVRTLDVSWGLEPPSSADRPRSKFEPREDGPALCGPIAVRGAEPGMTLEVRIEKVVPASWGWTYAGSDMSPLNPELGLSGTPLRLVKWRLDGETGRAISDLGVSVPLRPFLGTVGVAPPSPEVRSGWHPYAGGGNMDCRELVAGSSLYLPVLAPGALVSVGDGHARQGDGEVGGMAIECPMDDVQLRFGLLEQPHRDGPWAETPAGLITFGFAAQLDDAIAMALDRMLDRLAERYGITRPDALALASAAVEMRITQVVNGTKGVHALLPHDVVEPITA